MSCIFSGTTFDVAGKQSRLVAIEEMLHSQEFWSDTSRAREIMKEQRALKDVVDQLEAIGGELEELTVLLGLLREEDDPQALKELGSSLRSLESQIAAIELTTFMAGEYDSGNAILSINPGAGGTESQDWAQMLLRMYLRWAEAGGYKTEIIDLLPAEEAGIKSATVTVAGSYAYGRLKAEIGVHRLVRISPFDASHRRHTSFASVLVYPEIDETIEVAIDDKDLRIDTYRSSGAGGQHVNVTDSAVRITHLPTGIVVSCQNERSQHKNKAMAMKVLRARLYDHYRREQEKEMAKLEGEKKEIAWGSQIRSYVLAPYQLVKDHRTGLETSNVDKVLDGEIEPFIDAFLLKGRTSPGAAK
ncbi:MAG: peptide chain release factor 2 [candidate division NC10 bacterium]|nr:peptide chain release factor 2 [candidate division NC10 bacterium]MDE2484304.1 peptide chain release factor 2 [candidate division NC10 bacterium]